MNRRQPPPPPPRRQTPIVMPLRITSVRYELRGVHEIVWIWARSQCVGSLTMSPGDGVQLAALFGLEATPMLAGGP